MIQYREVEGTNIAEITVQGKVSRAEFDEVAANLERVIERHGSVRLLEDIRDFRGIDASAFWDDLKFSLRHLNDVSRAAIVAEERWVEWLVGTVRPFLKAELRTFTHAEVEAARSWLRQDA